LIARGIWATIKKWFNCRTQQELAVELGFADASSISRGLKHGELTLESLCLILTHAKKTWRDLPDLPPERDRVLAGYMSALESHDCEGGRARRPITQEELLCLMCLGKHRQGLAYVNRQLGEERLNQIAEEVLGQVARDLQLTSTSWAQIGGNSPREYLDKVTATWWCAYYCVRNEVARET
jgi:hypothetical protein